jgi:hypothetical protein
MTEAEWLACTDPAPMLDFLRGKASDRKLRLFGLACCQHIPHLVENEACRRMFNVIESCADGLTSTEELARAAEDVSGEWSGPWTWPPFDAWGQAWDGARLLAQEAAAEIYVADEAVQEGADYSTRSRVWDEAEAREKQAQAAIIRELFSNPFRPSRPLSPAVLAWSDGTVRRMVEGIYEERAFDRLPILADALLDAGCDDEELIAHCRGEGPHVRGCWAVDLILRKE